MKDKLIIVDMQNDFITGSLPAEGAKNLVDKIYNYASKFDGDIIFTKDTHDSDYPKTREGKDLPVIHCVNGTFGCELNPIIDKLAYKDNAKTVIKFGFGYNNWKDVLGDDVGTIYICGVCTDVCVITNALILRSLYTENDIVVLNDLCAGTTVENHQKALDILASCQCWVEPSEENE